MEKGWIKIHRKLLENPITKNPLWSWLWVVMLLKANHKPAKIIWNGKATLIKVGQMITSRDKLAEASGLSASMVERCLTYLENEHQIGQQKFSKFRLITITKWSEYQCERTPKRTTGGQQTDTNKNDKNEKEIRNFEEMGKLLKKYKPEFIK